MYVTNQDLLDALATIIRSLDKKIPYSRLIKLKFREGDSKQDYIDVYNSFKKDVSMTIIIYKEENQYQMLLKILNQLPKIQNG